MAAYLSSYHEKAIKTLQRVCLEVAGHLSATPRRGIPPNAFPTGTTSKLTGLFSTLVVVVVVVFYSTTIKIHRNNAYHDIRPKKR